jgi:HAD superfamily hydrolase (TIGR01509 family)
MSAKKDASLIEAVIFDIDGTLVDSVDLHALAWQEALVHFGKDIAFKEVRDQIGKGGDEILPMYFSEEELEELGEKIKTYRGDQFKSRYISSVRAFPKVRQLFEQVKSEGKKIALGSSAHKDELEHYVKLANIGDLIDVKTCADDAERSKPHPDIFSAALSKLDVKPEAAMVIGDSPFDAEAARKLNIPTIGFLCGGFSPDSLKKASAIALYGGPDDLLAKYRRSPLCA